jgi:hypothetical protein
MSNNGLAANVNALKALTEKVKTKLNQINNARTPAAANVPLQEAATAVKAMNNVAVKINNQAPGTPLANNAAKAAMAAGNGVAQAANGVAAMGVAAATQAPTPAANNAAKNATANATKSTNEALKGNPPGAATAAAATGNAAVAAAANASNNAKMIANSLKKQLLKVTNANNKPTKAFEILKSQFVNKGYYLNNPAYKQENVNRAYSNLMKNTNLTAAQKNALKRVYFAYKNRPGQVQGKNRPKINMNLTGLNNYNAYKKAAIKAAANAGRKNLNTGNMGTGKLFE